MRAVREIALVSALVDENKELKKELELYKIRETMLLAMLQRERELNNERT